MKFQDYLYKLFEEDSHGEPVDVSCPDSFENWFCLLDPEEIIDHADKWHESFYQPVKKGL